MNLDENIIEFVQNQGHGVKEKRDKIGLKKDHVDVSIPVINMSNLDEKEMETLICNTAEKWGFFEIINHEIPLKVLEDVKVATYRLSRTLKFIGFLSGAGSRISQTCLFHRASPSSARSFAFVRSTTDKISLRGEEKILKENSPTSAVTYGTSFIPELERDELLEYIKSSEVVTKHLVKVLMKGLKIHEINEKRVSFDGFKKNQSKLLSKCPKPELAIGVGATPIFQHSPFFFKTMLVDLCSRDRCECSVINVGDALQILSNGKYKSVEHLGFDSNLCESTPNSIIAPLQDMLNEEEEHNKPIYKEVLYLDYVKHFHQKAHDGKATIEFAKISITN
ncbi:F6'H1: Feruloyl CoA ortho-hydroxylase 1 [Bienertia sinuspersici]